MCAFVLMYFHVGMEERRSCLGNESKDLELHLTSEVFSIAFSTIICDSTILYVQRHNLLSYHISKIKVVLLVARYVSALGHGINFDSENMFGKFFSQYKLSWLKFHYPEESPSLLIGNIVPAFVIKGTYCFIFKGRAHNQLCSGATPRSVLKDQSGSLGRPYSVPRIKLKLATCKANALLAVNTPEGVLHFL